MPGTECAVRSVAVEHSKDGLTPNLAMIQVLVNEQRTENGDRLIKNVKTWVGANQKWYGADVVVREASKADLHSNEMSEIFFKSFLALNQRYRWLIRLTERSEPFLENLGRYLARLDVAFAGDEVIKGNIIDGAFAENSGIIFSRKYVERRLENSMIYYNRTKYGKVEYEYGKTRFTNIEDADDYVLVDSPCVNCHYNSQGDGVSKRLSSCNIDSVKGSVSNLVCVSRRGESDNNRFFPLIMQKATDSVSFSYQGQRSSVALCLSNKKDERRSFRSRELIERRLRTV